MITTVAFSQKPPGPGNQNPNDCIDAIPICGNSNINLDVDGPGTNEPFTSACSMQENNTIWFKLTFKEGGNFGFVLTPESKAITEDYDFALFGPTQSCSNLGAAIRCSSTNPQAANQGNNLTGMNGTDTDANEGPGADGNSFVSEIEVLAGETYYLLIDRPIGNSAFSLEWTGSSEFPSPPTNEIGAGGTSNIDNCDTTIPFNDGITEFNLEDNTALLIGSQTNIEVSYHLSESDAILGVSPLSSPYLNTSNPQTIYTKIRNTVTECFITSRFTISTTDIDIVTPTDYELCDSNINNNSNSGTALFDLESKIPEILINLNPEEYTYSFHLTEEDAENNIKPIASNFENTESNNQVLFARIEEIATNCFGITPINLVVNPLPEAKDTILLQCDEDGIPEGFTTFNLNQIYNDIIGSNDNRTIQFYTSILDLENGEDEINANAFENYLNPQIVYALVTDTISGCVNTAEVTLQASNTTSNNTKIEVCDDDGTEDGFYNFDLNSSTEAILSGSPSDLDVVFYETYENALLEKSPINPSFTNTTPYEQTIYARVEDMNACYGISEITLTVFEKPNIVTQETMYYCLNNFPDPIILKAGIINDLPNNYYYDWSTGENTSEIEINEPGTYTVRVTSTNGCIKDRTITVLPSDIATFTTVEVTDATANNIISVFVSGDGVYEYALDSPEGLYQDSNTFENVSFGFHTVYVRDTKNNCGTVTEIVSVIGFPKYFTPNGDSYNQYWQIKGVSNNFQPNSQLLIFDRFGKLLADIDPLGPGWDGTFRGSKMPASDYWYVISLEDGRTFTGNFTLKR